MAALNVDGIASDGALARPSFRVSATPVSGQKWVALSVWLSGIDRWHGHRLITAVLKARRKCSRLRAQYRARCAGAQLEKFASVHISETAPVGATTEAKAKPRAAATARAEARAGISFTSPAFRCRDVLSSRHEQQQQQPHEQQRRAEYSDACVPHAGHETGRQPGHALLDSQPGSA